MAKKIKTEIPNREERIARRQLRRLYESYLNTTNGDLMFHYKENAKIIKKELEKLVKKRERRNKK